MAQHYKPFVTLWPIKYVICIMRLISRSHTWHVTPFGVSDNKQANLLINVGSTDSTLATKWMINKRHITSCFYINIIIYRHKEYMDNLNK